MSFRSLLTHVVHLERDDDTGSTDDYNLPVTAVAVGQEFRAAIQPKSARELALVSQAGASIGNWTIYMTPREVSTADKIVHDSSACPLTSTNDLPDYTFELTGVRNAAGLGHHLEVDANVVGTPGSAIEGS